MKKLFIMAMMFLSFFGTTHAQSPDFTVTITPIQGKKAVFETTFNDINNDFAGGAGVYSDFSYYYSNGSDTVTESPAPVVFGEVFWSGSGWSDVNYVHSVDTLSLNGQNDMYYGIYRYIFEDSTGFLYTYCDTVAVNFTAVGMEDGILTTIPTVYPNPATDFVIIDGYNPGSSVSIMDMSGRILVVSQAQSDKLTLDVSSFPAGIYIVQVSGNTRLAKRILVQ